MKQMKKLGTRVRKELSHRKQYHKKATRECTLSLKDRGAGGGCYRFYLQHQHNTANYLLH